MRAAVRFPAAGIALLLGLALTACAAPGVGDVVRLPPAGAAVDYQLGGAYPPGDGVGIVARDSTEDPAPGVYGICYVNGFQTQPDARDLWLDEHPDLLLRDAAGDPVPDPGWPDELLLDVSTPERRAGILAVLGPVVTGCAASGYDAVELDNLDSFTRSDGLLTSDDALAMAAAYVAVAHDAGLAVAQKNAPDLARRGHDDVGFDLVVAEECHRYDECAAYTSVYGDAVVDIEYADDLRGTPDEVCADPRTPASTVIRDRLLTSPGDPDHVVHHC